MRQAVAMQLRAWMLRPTVVHRLPGRLRLRVPALQRLDRAQQDLALLWRDLLAGTPGFEAVEINLVTGSALIRYDTTVLREEEAVALLRSVNRFVLQHWERLAETPAEELPKVLQRLMSVAREAIRQKPTLDDAVEIPEDVWS